MANENLEQRADEREQESVEELLEQAQSNAQSTIIATVKFLTRRGIKISEWSEALGTTYSLGWDNPEPWGAGEFLDSMLTNYRSLGAEVVSCDLQPERATATITGFPDPDLCQLLEVDIDEVRHFNDVPIPIARERSLDWTWSSDSESTTFVVTQVTSGT